MIADSTAPLRQAVDLYALGYHVAAGAMARIALERAIRAAVDRANLTQPKTLNACAMLLRKAGRATRTEERRIRYCLEHANRCAHGYDVQEETVKQLLHGAVECCDFLSRVQGRKAVFA